MIKNQTKHAFDRELIRDRPWDQRLQFMLVILVALNLLPHLLSIPVWASLVSSGAIAYKLLYLRRGYPLPKKWLLAGAAILTTAATLLAFGTILGVEAASCLLVMLAALKLLETNRYRDAMLVIFTSYFLLMAHLLTSSSLISTLFMACDILIITSLMFHVHRRDRRRSGRSFRPAMRLLAFTLPVWILFFFLFPRFTAAVWDLKGSGTGTGFSDDLNPGAIERLAESDETAFRVIFNSMKSPAPADLYWRGDVLNEGDGLKWRRGAEPKPGLPDGFSSAAETGRPPTDYEIYLEPGFQKWLFVLDYATFFKAGEYLSRIGTFPTRALSYRIRQDLLARVTYTAKAGFDSPTFKLSAGEKHLLKELPPDLTPRFKDLTARLAREESSRGPLRAAALARRAVAYFTDNQFRYTIRPGALTANTGSLLLDEFIFEKKRGFCEHYAAAFATMMRAMDIPARVVVGFQGGRYNDIGGYMLVRQLDAHAWSEIWIDDQPDRGHWMRVDPTEEIAPLRLALGGEFNRLDAQTIGSMSGAEIRDQFDGRFMRIWYRASMTWDALQMRWNAFLIEYDLSAQLELLSRLGFKNVSVLLLIVTLALGLTFVGTILTLLLRGRGIRPDPVTQAWQRFCFTLAKRGVEKVISEGPLEYSLRAATRFPQRQNEIVGIAHQYIKLRYGKAGLNDRATLRAFKLQVRRFSLPLFRSSKLRDTTS